MGPQSPGPYQSHEAREGRERERESGREKEKAEREERRKKEEAEREERRKREQAAADVDALAMALEADVNDGGRDRKKRRSRRRYEDEVGFSSSVS